jgi:metallo-beta-lactamase class B
VNPGYVLVDNPDYPEVANDYRRTFARARELPVDVFLGSHGSFYGLAEKHERLQRRGPDDPNPFVDRAGYLAHVAAQASRCSTGTAGPSTPRQAPGRSIRRSG